MLVPSTEEQIKQRLKLLTEPFAMLMAAILGLYIPMLPISLGVALSAISVPFYGAWPIIWVVITLGAWVASVPLFPYTFLLPIVFSVGLAFVPVHPAILITLGIYIFPVAAFFLICWWTFKLENTLRAHFHLTTHYIRTDDPLDPLELQEVRFCRSRQAKAYANFFTYMQHKLREHRQQDQNIDNTTENNGTT